MRFEFHCHTYYSKGKKLPWEALNSPEEIFREAKRKKLDGVAITDHNTVQGWKRSKEAAKKQGIIFIPGIEINTLEGHVIALGVNELIPSDLSLEETLDRIREQGGISIAAHPFDIKGEGIGMRFVKCDAVEVFNALNLDRFSNVLARKKALQTKVSMVCGSDAHTCEMVGTAVNLIDCSDPEEILKKIKKGKVSIRTKYIPPPVLKHWIRERLRLSYSDAVRYMENNYHPVKRWIAKRLLYKFLHKRGELLWNFLEGFGICCSYIYGSINMFCKW